MARLFIAVSVDAAREGLAKILRELRSTGADFKWVRPEHLHLTLRFLGEREEPVAEALEAAMREAAAGRAPFALKLSGLGAFPDWRRPRVAWIGVGEGAGELSRMAADLGAALRARGISLPEEEREFVPHLTLGRMRGPSGLGRLKTEVERLAARDLGLPAVPIDRLLLIESRLFSAGPSYAVLRAVPLAGT